MAASVADSDNRSTKEKPSEGTDGDKTASRRPRKRTTGKAKEDKIKTKLVVRRLPPNLPEEVFEASVEKWLEETDWWTYVAGKLAKSQAKVSVFSRAYLNFKTPEALLEFYNAYNGHRFVDSRGNMFQAMVELAPFQRVAKKKRRPDARMNTIEQDSEYLNFLKSLEEPKEQPESSISTGETQLEKLEKKLLAEQQGKEPVVTSAVASVATVTASQLAAQDKPKSTPLLDELRAKKAALRAGLESNKQANLKAQAEKAQTAAKGSAKAPPSPKVKKASAATKAGKGEAEKPSAIAKRSTAGPVKKSPSSPTPPKRESPAGSPKQKPKEAKKERIAPSGSLFKGSLAAALGVPDPKKTRGRQNKQAKDDDKTKDAGVSQASVSGSSNAPVAETATTRGEGGRSRGYRNKRQALVSGTADTTSAAENGISQKQNDTAADTKDATQNQAPADNQGRSNRTKRGKDSVAEGLSEAMGNLSVASGGKPKEAWAEKDSNRSEAKSRPRSRMPSNSSSTSSAPQRQQSQAQPAQRATMTVSIMKRDGATTNRQI